MNKYHKYALTLLTTSLLLPTALHANEKEDTSAMPAGLITPAENLPWLGIVLGENCAELWAADRQTARSQDIPRQGIYVRAVAPNSPAAEAGLQAGDVITRIDSEAIESYADVLLALENIDSIEKPFNIRYESLEVLDNGRKRWAREQERITAVSHIDYIQNAFQITVEADQSQTIRHHSMAGAQLFNGTELPCYPRIDVKPLGEISLSLVIHTNNNQSHDTVTLSARETTLDLEILENHRNSNGTQIVIPLEIDAIEALKPIAHALDVTISLSGDTSTNLTLKDSAWLIWQDTLSAWRYSTESDAD